MRDFLAITNALSDESRLRMFAALEGGELCVCQLIDLLDLAPSTVSKHLDLLKRARLVESRKQGRWMYYRRASASTSETIRVAVRWVEGSLAGDPRIEADAKRLRALRKADLEALCCARREGARRRRTGAAS